MPGANNLLKSISFFWRCLSLYSPRRLDFRVASHSRDNQPELYHGLPKDPQIDTSINLWKGALKPLAAAGFIATFAGLIYHYIGIGPNKETDDDEEDHHE